MKKSVVVASAWEQQRPVRKQQQQPLQKQQQQFSSSKACSATSQYRELDGTCTRGNNSSDRKTLTNSTKEITTRCYHGLSPHEYANSSSSSLPSLLLFSMESNTTTLDGAACTTSDTIDDDDEVGNNNDHYDYNDFHASMKMTQERAHAMTNTAQQQQQQQQEVWGEKSYKDAADRAEDAASKKQSTAQIVPKSPYFMPSPALSSSSSFFSDTKPPPRRQLPCRTFISTGNCDFNGKCAFIHDYRVADTYKVTTAAVAKAQGGKATATTSAVKSNSNSKIIYNTNANTAAASSEMTLDSFFWNPVPFIDTSLPESYYALPSKYSTFIDTINQKRAHMSQNPSSSSSGSNDKYDFYNHNNNSIGRNASKNSHLSVNCLSVFSMWSHFTHKLDPRSEAVAESVFNEVTGSRRLKVFTALSNAQKISK